MVVDRMDADFQRLGDLFTGFALGYQPTDFLLSRCEFILTHVHLYPNPVTVCSETTYAGFVSIHWMR
jgi:hypothetical protein